jgi:arabinofuranan 3-O-arabinosyltransferase
VAVIPSLLARGRAGLRSRVRTAPLRVDAIVWLLLVAGSFLQQPGRTTFDTKFDLTADPLRFLGRSLHLWNPQASLGELQNQSYGYLFPQGPFFVLGQLLGLPDWVTQRIWCAVLLIAAYEGARRLFRALDAGPWWAARLAGLAYAFTPRLLSEVGVLSGEIVPTVVLPWVVLPLVRAHRGELSARTAALLSGVAILFMGGLNAVENLAALPLPFLVAVAAAPGLRLRLTAWWLAAVSAAASWWLLPLIFLGTYSPPFLDYVESAAVTTGPLSLANVARGADQWLQFFATGGQPWWPAGFALATMPLLVAVTALVAACGFAGLWRPTMPMRTPFVASLLIGLACLYAGHSGALGSPVAPWVQDMLDGPLAALRNVHKVDPLVRLPLALGFGHLAAVSVPAILRRSAARASRRRPMSGRTASSKGKVGVTAIVGVLSALLLVSAAPLFTGDLRTPGWTAIPNAWKQAADYLARHDDGSRALVVPGSGFGQQRWGRTIDEPLQGLARSPWVTRSQVPLAPGQTIRMLDSLQRRINSGAGSYFLADALARAGIGSLVLRHDLDPTLSDAPSSARVASVLGRTPGLHRVAAYGDSGVAGYPEVEIWRVDRDVRRVEAVEASDVRTLAGSADDVFGVLESGLLGAGQPLVAVGQQNALSGPIDFVSDAYRLREQNFGRSNDATSADMTPDDPWQQSRRVHDYPGTPGLERVHLDAGRISSVTASSSFGYADVLGPVRPEFGPYAALDAGLDTAWLSAPLTEPTGQWLRVSFTDAFPVGRVEVATDTSVGRSLPVRTLRVRAGGSTQLVEVDPRTGVAVVDFDGSPVQSVQVTVARVAGDHDLGVVGIRDLSVARLARHQELVVPRSRTHTRTSWVLAADPGRRGCLATLAGPSCHLDDARAPEASVELARALTLSTPQELFVSGTVVARSTRASAALLEPFGDGVRVRAGSVLADDPLVSGQASFDGDLSTSWLAAAGVQQPSLRLDWPGRRTVDRIQVVNSLSDAVAPRRVVVIADDERRHVDLAGGFGFFDPVRTDHLILRFPRPAGAQEGRPMGVAELKLPALEDLRHRIDPTAATGSVCGLGPTLYVDGRARRTFVSGSIDNVLSGTSLRLGLCGGPLQLSAGEHHLSLHATEQWAVSQLVLSPRNTLPDDATRRKVTITGWGDTRRTMRVAAGPAAVLRVPENANPGWQARLGDEELVATRVDGWQQAWIVPAGEGGTVELSFAPDDSYRTGLLVGGLLAGLLIVCAIASLLLDRRRVPRSLARNSYASAGAARWRFVATLFVVTATALVGGPAVVVGLGAAILIRSTRWDGAVPFGVVGPGLIGLSGVVAAFVAGLGHGDVSPWWAEALAGAALGVMVAELVAIPRRHTLGTEEQA